MSEGPTQGDEPQGGEQPTPGPTDPYAAPPPGTTPPPPPGPPPGWGQPTPPSYGAPPGWGQPTPPPYAAPPPGQPPYGGYPPPPPPYGQPYPGYGYAPPRETEQLAVWALVLGIAAWVLCPVIPAIAALIVASRADAAIAASGGRLGGAGMVKAGRILSWVHLALIGVGILFIVVVAIAGGFASNSSY